MLYRARIISGWEEVYKNKKSNHKNPNLIFFTHKFSIQLFPCVFHHPCAERNTGKDLYMNRVNIRSVKKVLGLKLVEPGIIEVKLEATKRRKIWLARNNTSGFSCSDSACPLYRNCASLPSPLLKYPNLSEFCNHLYTDYPTLNTQLALRFGITGINQVVMYEKSNRNKKGGGR